ncbi:SulP family inorganic anion transporter [Terrilactibacillus sp. S3-3]|nr:SulP family inorganic anion transporter [Terrilactibacillus sp. S3-3]
MFGSSSTVVALESAVGIASGAKTGLSTVVAGIAFILSLILLPFINAIPASAVSPLLIIIGSLMLGNVRFINFNDFSEYFPSFLIIIMIPLSYNISSGMAFGFISYIIIKILCGKWKQLNSAILIVGTLFLLNFILPLI